MPINNKEGLKGADASQKAQSLEKTGGREKVGVYICHCGGNISDHVDVAQVAENVKSLPGVEQVHTNSFMCSDPGQELIQKDIESGKINRVVVASCAPSLHETTFRGAIKRSGMNPYLYEHANIREQVSWVHHGEPATAKATKLIEAAIAKAKKLEALDPIRVDAKRHVTVVGGGMAGMRAALDLVRQGFEVSIIEKTVFLGGNAAGLDRLSPHDQDAGALIRELHANLMRQDGVSIHTCAEISSFSGFVGNFELSVSQVPFDVTRAWQPGSYVENRGIYVGNTWTANEPCQLKTGAVVMATGFKSHIPAKGTFGFGDMDRVVTLADFIRAFKEAKIKDGLFHLDHRPVRRVAFIHCVGSRQIPGIHEPDENGNLNEYCSRTCCSATLQAALKLKKECPGTDVFDFYRDIRTYGRFQEDIYDEAASSGILFMRYEPDAQPVVAHTPDNEFPVSVSVKDVLTFNEEVEAEVDLVVLATAMEPNNISSLVEMMKLPVGADRFLQEVHPKLRPVEVANTGILLAGTCQAPMDITETCAAAQAACVKTSALLGKGFVELDPFVAQVDTGRCKGHGACREACPVDDAIELHDGKARVNPALCTGCGICTAVCPENAIDVNGWSLSQYEKMVDAILAA
ncbi:MAG: CoB--CoM heterodisulfide reductase iron-sulfur subunit A family protein [Desulfobacter sp.]|nr:MAG: CoB--CoM heterodisulfide reductase iron-sulfur subunit A family protein [Desulfobacter sp.]